MKTKRKASIHFCKYAYYTLHTAYETHKHTHMLAHVLCVRIFMQLFTFHGVGVAYLWHSIFTIHSSRYVMQKYLAIQMVQDVEASYMATGFVIKYLKCGSVHCPTVYTQNIWKSWNIRTYLARYMPFLHYNPSLSTFWCTAMIFSPPCLANFRVSTKIATKKKVFFFIFFLENSVLTRV